MEYMEAPFMDQFSLKNLDNLEDLKSPESDLLHVFNHRSDSCLSSTNTNMFSSDFFSDTFT